MDIVLILLAVLGFATVILALFMMSLIHGSGDSRTGCGRGANPLIAERKSTDRRQNSFASFPLLLDGVLISEDRRKMPDRRHALA